jgi:hypothetical protein
MAVQSVQRLSYPNGSPSIGRSQLLSCWNMALFHIALFRLRPDEREHTEGVADEAPSRCVSLQFPASVLRPTSCMLAVLVAPAHDTAYSSYSPSDGQDRNKIGCERCRGLRTTGLL